MAGGRVQKNKKHKSRFSSKSLKNRHKTSKESFGEQNVKSIKQTINSTLGRAQRIQRTKMMRDKKRSEILEKKRSQVGHGGVPCVVVLVGLHKDVNVRNIRNRLLIECKKAQNENLDTSSTFGEKDANDVEMSENVETKKMIGNEIIDDDIFVKGLMNEITVSIPKHKLRITIMEVDREKDLMTTLEFVKVADILFMVAPSLSSSSSSSTSDPKTAETNCIDDWGKKFISMSRAQGMPTVIGTVESNLSLSGKSRAEIKKKSISILETQLPEKSRIFSTDTSEEFQTLLRYFSNFHQSAPVWRCQRPYVIAHKIEFLANEENSDRGKLLFSGYLRGRGISVNQLVHVAGVGDFQLLQIDGPDDPCPLKTRAKVKKDQDESMREVDSESNVLANADPETREAIVIENKPDPLAGEQTWPTEEEMLEAKQNRKMKRKIVPKGTSEYQAAWYVSESEDEENDDDSYNDNEYAYENKNKENKFKKNFQIQGKTLEDNRVDENENNENDMDEDLIKNEREGNSYNEDKGDESEWEDIYENNEIHNYDKSDVLSSRAPSVFDDDDRDESMMDESENLDEEQREEERKRILAEHEDDEKFPDEIDTPMDVPARKRFQKYRGLKNFKSSFWDPKESLPIEYSKIFALENPKKIHKSVLKKAANVDAGNSDGSVQINNFIKLHIENFSKDDYDKLKSGSLSRPLVAFGLLKHETKMSVLHFSVKKNEDVTEPIKSKQELIFHVGFKRFTTRPIFSVDDMRSDKHKFEKFFHSGRFSIASIFAPICFSPLPVLIFRADDGLSDETKFVGSGSFRSANPDRIILKRIILSGYPFSVSKRKAVVRFMFFNPEDVRYFKPLELYTKLGRRGRIKEPMGLKGNMKCIFDAVVQQNDTVCLNLYKRVFPKWPSK